MQDAQKTIKPGTRVRLFRPDGSAVEGVIMADPLPWLAPFGEWYRVYRTAPVRYETKVGRTKARKTLVDVVDELGLYPRYRLMEVR